MASGLDSKDLYRLEISANFHDIGKLGIPDQVLYKPAKLDPVEKDLVEQHCLIGAEIILATDVDDAEIIADAVRHHHERYDGRGYPSCLKGEAIPLFARIIGITDSYDAMAETRAYHNPRSHDEIIGVMRGETGGKHDPQLMKYFCRMFETDSDLVAC